ncbi:hypothetical protein DIPPA_15548 [Diplonema papillatum]|nr:hypothetical protein DIPPA_15548 [Diplonema papillatum]
MPGPTAVDIARANATAAAAHAHATEQWRYHSTENMKAQKYANSVAAESAGRSKFLSDLHRLEAEMALQHNRAAHTDTAVRANPYSPERVRLAPHMPPIAF